MIVSALLDLWELTRYENNEENTTASFHPVHKNEYTFTAYPSGMNIFVLLDADCTRHILKELSPRDRILLAVICKSMGDIVVAGHPEKGEFNNTCKDSSISRRMMHRTPHITLHGGNIVLSPESNNKVIYGKNIHKLHDVSTCNVRVASITFRDYNEWYQGTGIPQVIHLVGNYDYLTRLTLNNAARLRISDIKKCKMPLLEYINLRDSYATVDVIVHLAGPRTVHLDLGGSQITMTGLRRLSCPNLRVLKLFNCQRIKTSMTQELRNMFPWLLECLDIRWCGNTHILTCFNSDNLSTLKMLGIYSQNGQPIIENYINTAPKLKYICLHGSPNFIANYCKINLTRFTRIGLAEYIGGNGTLYVCHPMLSTLGEMPSTYSNEFATWIQQSPLFIGNTQIIVKKRVSCGKYIGRTAHGYKNYILMREK